LGLFWRFGDLAIWRFGDCDANPHIAHTKKRLPRPAQLGRLLKIGVLFKDTVTLKVTCSSAPSTREKILDLSEFT